MADLMRFIKRKFAYNIHYAYRLEYRDRARSSEGVIGYHYHIYLIFDRDIKSDNKELVKAVRSFWEKRFNVKPFVTGVMLTPSVISEFTINKPNGIKFQIKLNEPVESTDNSKKHSLWYWLSYLTKEDPSQKLPADFKGKTFYCSIAK